MKKFLITVIIVLIALSCAFGVLFTQNVYGFKYWFMETTELLLPIPKKVKTVADAEKLFSVEFPKNAVVRNFL